MVLTDLAEEQGTANLLARMDGKPVDVLVNNAGFGLGLEFADSDIKDIRRLIFLQTSAIAELTHYVLRDMKKKHHGTIKLIKVLAGLLPQKVYYGLAGIFVKKFL